MSKLVMLLVCLFLASCTIDSPTTNAVQEVIDSTPNYVALLPELDLESIESYQDYKELAEGINSLVRVLNEQSDYFNLPYFQTDQAAYEKISRVVVEYGPLIDNYQETISFAKIYRQNPTDINQENFYKAAAKFGFEITIIATATFYTASYKGVWHLYQASGLSWLAPKCPTCVKVILKEAHWQLRNTMVAVSSQGAQFILDVLDDAQLFIDTFDFEKMKEKGNAWVDSLNQRIQSGMNRS